jgi:hypothetical protein
MRPTKAFANKLFAANTLIIGAAFLALAFFSPKPVFAATITIFHDNTSNLSIVSNNPFDSSHTVVAAVSGVTGHCSDLGLCSGDGTTSCRSDAECVFNGACTGVVDPEPAGGTCAADADCDAGDFCSFSGFPVGITVTAGPNVGAGNDTFTNTDVLGQVSFTYKDLGGVGTDTLEGCLDTGADEPGDDATVTDCIASSGFEDFASNTLTKNWQPTVTLTPSGAFNLTGTTHTLTATVNGAARCVGGTIPGTSCLHDSDCTGGGTCTDKSGILVGFDVVSGPNSPLESTFLSTDSNGQATFTYSDAGGAGTDAIQACADLFNDGDGDVSACLTDAAAGGGDSPFDDIASNQAIKKWGTINATLTPPVAFNAIGEPHTVTATVVGLTEHCSNNFATTCTLDAQCGAGTCNLAGYPVFFAVVGTCTGGNNGGATCTANAQCDSNVCTGGPNLGDLTSGTTDASGSASSTYTSLVAGKDTIQACVDGDPSGFGLSDDGLNGFLMCYHDAATETDVPTNTVTKNWFANYITGGAGVVVGKSKKNLHFSGIVGSATGPGIIGEYEASSSVGGNNVNCHYDTFTSLVFSGPATINPPSTHNTATFTTGLGKCNDGTTNTLTVTGVDNVEGKKNPPDTINVTSSDPRFNTGGTLPLVTGNLQVHDIVP